MFDRVSVYVYIIHTRYITDQLRVIYLIEVKYITRWCIRKYYRQPHGGP